MTRSWPLVSVVVPSFNAKSLVEQSISSLVDQSYKNLEIIIVDDCSTDGTADLIKSKYKASKKVRLIQNPQNFGPSRTRNSGISEAKGKYVAFFETDMKATRSWIQNMVRAFEADSTIGAMHSRVFDLKRPKNIQADGMLLIPYTGWVVMRNYGTTQELADSDMKPVVIGSVGTMVRRSILRQIGGFDEKLGHKVDDIDMGWRIWLTGYKTVCNPKAVTYHWGGKPKSVRQISTAKAEVYFHRMTRVFIKNYELKNLLLYFPWLIGLHFVRAVKHLFSGNINPIMGFINSLVWTVTGLPDTLAQRKAIQSFRKISDSTLFDNIMIKGNILKVWNTYVIPTHQIADTVFSKV